MSSYALTTTTPSDGERLAASIAHLGTLVSWTLAPLLVYVLKRGDSKYVEFQALQALLWSLAGTAIAAATCGLAIPVFLVWHVIAGAKAIDGKEYEYPIVGELARKWVYG